MSSSTRISDHSSDGTESEAIVETCVPIEEPSWKSDSLRSLEDMLEQCHVDVGMKEVLAIMEISVLSITM